MAEQQDNFVAFSRPDIGPDEIAEAVDTLGSDWITTGPKVSRLEEEFRNFVGAPAALALASATDAMLVALAALDVGPGDEVISTPMTFCSTLHVIEHRGARPRLVDVEPDTLNLDPAQAAAAVNPATRAILPVHLYGHPCDLDSIHALAGRHGLAVVEDAAHALPAGYKGRMIGSGGNLTAFSFYATKNMTTGEGGMLTGDAELIERCRPWSLHGMSRDAYKRYSAQGSWRYEVVQPGYKCNLTDIAASLGIHQLRRLPAFQQRRREIVDRYNQGLAGLAEISAPTFRPEVEPAWHLYVIRLNLGRLAIDRDKFIEQLRQRGIGASVHFIPNHLQPYYRDKYGYRPEDFPVAWAEFQRIISLPLHTRMSDAEVDRVIQAVRAVAEAGRKRVTAAG